MSRQQRTEPDIEPRVMTKAEYRDWSGSEPSVPPPGWQECTHRPPHGIRLDQGPGEPAIFVILGHHHVVPPSKCNHTPPCAGVGL